MRSVLMLLALSPLLLADLASVKNEPNLERRSELALDEADREIDNARNAYKASDDKGFRTSLDTISQAAELTYASLKQTGKNARKHPKYFKKADLRMHALLRRIEGLEQEVLYDDRQFVEAAKAKVTQIDDQIVMDIMKK